MDCSNVSVCAYKYELYLSSSNQTIKERSQVSQCDSYPPQSLDTIAMHKMLRAIFFFAGIVRGLKCTVL